MLEDLELLEQHKPRRVRRRLEHGEAAVLDADRLLPLGLEGFKIASRDQRTGRFESRCQAPSKAAAIKGFRPGRGYLLERARQVWLKDRGAHARGDSLGRGGNLL